AGSGSYRLTLAKTGSPGAVARGDEGGPMTNGVMHTGTIDIGDLDVWTFQATNGDSIVVRAGETVSGSALTPWVRLYGPDGAVLGAFVSVSGAEVSVRATNNGVFLVVIGDGGTALAGSGGYRLTLAKTGSP